LGVGGGWSSCLWWLQGVCFFVVVVGPRNFSWGVLGRGGGCDKNEEKKKGGKDDGAEPVTKKRLC